eukprot:scaffold518_cov388-Prasinococcus_capsulatus_cf.AAC.20
MLRCSPKPCRLPTPAITAASLPVVDSKKTARLVSSLGYLAANPWLRSGAPSLVRVQRVRDDGQLQGLTSAKEWCRRSHTDPAARTACGWSRRQWTFPWPARCQSVESAAGAKSSAIARPRHRTRGPWVLRSPECRTHSPEPTETHTERQQQAQPWVTDSAAETWRRAYERLNPAPQGRYQLPTKQRQGWPARD